MFKFNFDVEEERDNLNPFIEPEDEVSPTDKKEASHADKLESCYETERITITGDALGDLDVYKLNAAQMTAGETTVQYVITGFLLQDVQEKNDDANRDIRQAEQSHTDLIPGVYEGGAKIWECTEDLLQYLAKTYTNDTLRAKRVLDLGCGAGLLGIYAYKCGSTVHFQDYNKDVLETITVPNVLLNVAAPTGDLDLEKLNDHIKFYSGDWRKYTEYTGDCTAQQFDLILTSETIYNPQNQQKLLDTLFAKLKPGGVVLVAAKIYYFGVGGGLRQFEELIVRDKRFASSTIWSSTEGVCREIIELKRL